MQGKEQSMELRKYNFWISMPGILFFGFHTYLKKIYQQMILCRMSLLSDSMKGGCSFKLG